MKCCAIILAAGRGSRMGSLTNNLPKGLLGPPGKTPIESQLLNLKKIGVNDTIIVTGYLAAYFDKFNKKTIFNSEWYTSNMVYSLSKAFNWADKFDQILVSYSDIFFPISALESVMKQNADISILYDADWLRTWEARFEDPLTDAETFRIDDAGNLVEIGQKPSGKDIIEGQYMGLLNFSRLGWQTFFNFIFTLDNDQQKKIDMTSALDLFRKTNQSKINCVPFSGIWGEIDSKSDYELYFG